METISPGVGDPKTSGKTKLLNAALRVIRTKGYGASTVDDICRAAGVSKGSFFHYFPDKEALGIAAAEHFSSAAAQFFAGAAYRSEPDPRERVLQYVDQRAAMLRGDFADFTCLLGTMVQETYATHPALRAVCDEHIRLHADDVARDIEAAKRAYAPDAPWTAQGMALYTQAVIQGAFVLAKAHDDTTVGVECLAHLRRYLETQFPKPTHN
ncbi:MAG TPA: TetR/AcrR family transcriptional regulator [Candidatus Lustribacter sp.]|jgi:TetR/AcrR family transcriptional repressor of nem operon|nr:TetR/AcrR family transcriptional regulator [Candidatus Lustribacter sp.]